MTTEQFLALPDREKDALVAEKVMGWQLYSGFWYSDNFVYATEDGPIADPFPDYSTNISAAWEVVEKVFTTQFCLSYGDNEWVVFPTWHADSWNEASRATTAQLAICLAALKAKGIIKE